MAIKLNHTTNTINIVADAVEQNKILTITGTGALRLPLGNRYSERPVTSGPGLLRYSTDAKYPEYFDGTDWQLLANVSYVTNNIDNSVAAALGLAPGVDGTPAPTVAQVISSLTLNDLADVTITTPSAGQVLTYDAVLGEFRSQTTTLTPTTRRFMGDGSTASFDLQTTVSTPNLLVVSINGITQEPFYSYSVIEGSTLSFDEAPEQSDRIEVRILRSNTTSDRPRPKITNISYSQLGQYTTISVVATDIAYGAGAKIGNQSVTRIDYPSENTIRLMIETSRVSYPIWNTSQDLTLVDTSGNEYTYKNLINYGASRPYWTNSAAYIGTFSSGDTINFKLGVNNYTSLTIDPAYAGEAAITWISIAGDSIVGTAPQASIPSRYEFAITASNGNIDIVKNCWLLVI